MGVFGQRQVHAALPPGEKPSTYCSGGWVVSSAGLDSSAKSHLYLYSIPGTVQPRSESLKWLSCPSSYLTSREYHKL